MELVQKYQLYDEALKLYKGNAMYKKICLVYAEQLLNSSKYEAAAAMFRLGENYPEALNAYKRSENYQLAKSMAMLMQMNKEQIKQLAEEFLNTFRTADNYKEVSEVLLDLYHNNMLESKEQVEELVHALVKSQDYFRAIKIASETLRADLISGEIYKEVLLNYDILYNELQANINSYNEKYKRLEVVQQQKRLMPPLAEEALPMGLDAMEIASESGKSKISRSSKRSSSGKRKVQRKAVIKEGSRFEEEQIIEYLEGLVPSLDKAKSVDDAKRSLEFFGCKEEITKLDNVLKELQQLTKTPLLSYEQMKVIEKIPNFFEAFPKLNPKSVK